MSVNKKIHYGDSFDKSVNEDITGEQTSPNPPTDKFTFDSMLITFDSLLETFDEI